MILTAKKPSPTFCPIPWVSASVTNQGIFRACCQCSQSSCGGILRNEDGIPLNAAKDKMDGVRNNQTLKQMRRDMLDGVQNPLCRACWEEEDAGIVSKRQSEIKKLGKFFKYKDAVHLTSDSGDIPHNTPMLSLDVRFGNNCNLVCRMCNPLDSKAWYSDYVALKDETKIVTPIGYIELQKIGTNNNWNSVDDKMFNWYEQPLFWDQLEHFAEQIKYIYMAGGEPLITPKHHEFLNRLVELDVAQNIELDYATNFTILPEEVLRSWAKFKGVNLGISIDGVGKINDYIRYPSQWEKIEKNFDRIEELNSVNLHVYTNSTISALNLPSSLTSLKWFIKRRRENKKFPQNMFVHPVYDLTYLSPKVLPRAIKEKVNRDLQDFKEILEGKTDFKIFKQSVEQYQNIASFSLSEDLDTLYDQLVEETEKLDHIRNHSWKDFLDFNLNRDR